MQRRILPVLMLATMVACSEAPPVAPVPGPQPDYLNGPSELPNLIRFEDRYALLIADPESDLLLLAGLEYAAQICEVGPFGDPVSFQQVGDIESGIHELVMGGDLHLLLFRLSTFPGFCDASPIAVGTGRVHHTDNDLIFSGNGANTFAFRVNGGLEFLDGGLARVDAYVRYLQQRTSSGDVEFRVLVRNVVLSGQ